MKWYSYEAHCARQGNSSCRDAADRCRGYRFCLLECPPHFFEMPSAPDWCEDVRRCRTGLNPHFLFVLPKRKRPFMVKRKSAWGDELTRECQLTQNEGPAAPHCHASPAASCRLRRQIFLEELRPRIWQHGIYRAAIPDLTSFSFRAPRFAQRWLVLFPGGVSKGEGRSPPLCVVSRGCGGKSKSPRVSL